MNHNAVHTNERLTTNPLADERDLIRCFQADAEERGLVGEKDNAATVLLCAVSARLSKPLNLTVNGESSSGKNFLLNKVAECLPDEHKKVLTGMSPKALMHAQEDEFQNKAVFIAEYEGVSKADYAIRTFQSEKAIEWDFVESSSAGIKKKNRKVKGPAAFLQATTRPVLHPENETRLLFISLDESAGQTEAIIRRQAQEAMNGEAENNDKKIPLWQEFLRSLKPMMITIPYADKLGATFPADRVRSRRDFPKLLALIETSAYTHQLHREKNGDRIVASVDDYLNAKRLFENCYATGPDNTLGELLDAAEAISARKPEFRASDLIERTGWGQSKVYAVLDRAEELGCLAESDRGIYRFIRRSIVPPLTLPDSVSR